MITLELKENDRLLADEIYENCKAVASYNLISNFDGNMLIQIVLPLATVLSPVFLKYLENQKVTVKFDGIEISAPKKDVQNILRMIQNNRAKDGEK